MRILPEKLHIDFMGWRWLGFSVSGLIVLASIVLPLTIGLNFGIDFRGGILIEARSNQGLDMAEMRESLDGLDMGEITLQQFGTDNDVLIRVQQQSGGETVQQQAIQKIRDKLGANYEFRRVETVGPKVGSELKRAGSLAAFLAIGAIGLYIWFRFEWQYGLAALIALSHDVISTIGIYALTQIDFNLSTVAAVLTVAGYSINDTVVIFDRVREVRKKHRSMSTFELLNRSANETLSRTILTSSSTFVAVLALYLVGGEVLRSFSVGVLWGIIAGTYSSVGLACPLLLYFRLRNPAAAEVIPPSVIPPSRQ